MANKLNDLTGIRFGRLTVVERRGSSKQGEPLWYCVCDCGNTNIVRAQSLKKGHTKSCGCLSAEMVACRHITHGKKGTRLYDVWKNMKKRCFNANSPNYKDYGGRGITVCEEWKDDFKSFYDWAMDNGYDESALRGKFTIDRIDVNGNYEPSNCRWATAEEQNNNKRINRMLTYAGKTQTLEQWARETGINRQTIRNRIDKFHWSVEKALTTKTH